MKPALQISNLTFRFQTQSTPFFQDVQFQLEMGKIHRLKGKNGSGKSTLFHILQGDVEGNYVCEGNLRIEDQAYSLHALTRIKPQLQQSIALVNQRYDSMIADQFTFDDNLKFAYIPYQP